MYISISITPLNKVVIQNVDNYIIPRICYIPSRTLSWTDAVFHNNLCSALGETIFLHLLSFNRLGNGSMCRCYCNTNRT